MRTIKAWGLDPDRWRLLSVDAKGRMMAFDWLEGQRDGYEAEKVEEAAEKKKGSSSSKGTPMIRQSDMGWMHDAFNGLAPQ